MPLLNRRNVLAGAAGLAASVMATRSWGQPASDGPFKLPPLGYPVDSLAPHIDGKTMEIHHGRHHAAYVKTLNEAVKDHGELAKQPLEKILANLNNVPDDIRTRVRNNAGGHANHTMFWQVLGKDGGKPDGELLAAIDRDFVSLDQMQEAFNKAGAGVFGSGWVFITADKAGKLALISKPNQDTPLMDGQRVLFGNDVWEHAYYLTFQNRRPDYLKAWWNVVNWSAVGQRFAQAKAGTLNI